jgi:hypothetical protein
MKTFYRIIGFLIAQCLISFAQTQTFYVRPNQTDINYSSAQDSNYVVRNTSTQINSLVLFLGGSYSSPDDYSIFCQYPATLGFDVISLSYPNSVATAPLGASSDSLVFNKYRQEVCFGTALSTAVSVDTLNSIYTRTLKLIQYLNTTKPSQNWGQYLLTSTTLDWSKIIVSGHSQGSGHACYLGKNFPVKRVLMFSGPNDFSTFFNNSANWLRKSGLTPTINHFAFLHIQDEIVPYVNQKANLTGLGMLAADVPTLIDNLSYPYSNSHFLYTNIPAISYHASTIGANTILPPVWNYMLTSSLTTVLRDLRANDEIIRIYPNPAQTELKIDLSQNDINELSVRNLLGQDLIILKNKNSIDISSLPNGIYILTVKQGENIYSKKFIKEH